MNILGVRVDNLSRKEILARIEYFLHEEKFHQIATINPEFVLEAQNNKTFKNVLNGCSLNVADGVGITYAFARYSKRLRCRLSGADLMREILVMANEKKLGVFLACNSGGLSSYEKIRDTLAKEYPNAFFGGASIDPRDSHVYKMQDSRYEILLCNFGAPHQEVFINSLSGGRIRLAMGVGGSFDFLTGMTRRAPQFLQRVGLEWLWRLMIEPRYRFKRIWRAVIVFPIKILAVK